MAHSAIFYEQIVPMTASQLSSLVKDDDVAFLNVANIFTQDQAIIDGKGLSIGLVGTRLASLDIRGDTETSLWLSAYSNTAVAQMVFRRAGGTQASPTTVPINTSLGSFSFRGLASGTVFSTSRALIDVLTNEPWNIAGNGTRLVISTTPTGTTTLLERLRFTEGETVFNETQVNQNVRMESDAEANMFLLDADGNTDGTLYFGGNSLTTASSYRRGGRFFPVQAPTASAPTYAIGAMYFDTTLNKLRIGGAAAWETVTST